MSTCDNRQKVRAYHRREQGATATSYAIPPGSPFRQTIAEDFRTFIGIPLAYSICGKKRA